MLTISQITLYYTHFLAYLLLILLAGNLLTKKASNNKSPHSLFNALFAGIVTIVVLTALVVTKFQTVYTGAVLLVFIAKWPLKLHGRLPKLTDSLHVKKMLPVLLAGSLFFGLNLVFHRSIGDTKIPHEDYLFYSQLANNLFHGFEGLNYKLYATGILTSKQLTPYHYFELWAAVPAIFATKNAVWSLNLVAYPLLQTIAFFGIYAIVAHFISANNRWIWFITLLLFFIGGLQFGFMHQFIARNYTGFLTDTTLFSQFGRKYGIIFITLYFAIHHFLKGNDRYYLTGLSLTAFFYPTVSPGILIFLLFYAYVEYNRSFKSNLWVLIPITLTIFPAFFYGVLSLLDHSTDPLSKEGPSFILRINYKAGIWFLIISAISLAIYLIPLFRVRKELTGPFKTITIMAAIVIVIGFLMSITIPMQRDQIQFYSNTLPFFLILIQVSLIIWIDKNRLWGYGFLAVISSYVFIKNFEKQNGFNRTVSEVTTPKQKIASNQLMKEHSQNCMYGFIWDSTKVAGLNDHSHLFLSSNYGYLKIHGYVNAINMSNLPNDKKSIPYDEPFQVYSMNKPYSEAYNQWLLSQKISFILNEQGEPIH